MHLDLRFWSLTILLLIPQAIGAQRWIRIKPTSSPSSRAGAAMVYDGARNRVTLFGGSNGSKLYNDTWVWDGTNWKQLTPSASFCSAVSSAASVWVARGNSTARLGRT